VTGGLALFSVGDLEVPAQPSFGAVIGYPLAAGPVVLELGLGLSYSPLPYDTMTTTEMASLFAIRPTIGVTYPLNQNLGLRGDLGLGVAMLGGLVDGNPWTEDRQAASFTLLSFRIGAAIDYAFTPNILATLSPVGLAISPGADGMYADTLTEFNVLLGLGYRM
jgi:hypothetical protein